MQPADRTALDSRQIELYRRASPSQKLTVVARLNAALIALKEAELKARLPEVSEKERRTLLRRWWLTASD